MKRPFIILPLIVIEFVLLAAGLIRVGVGTQLGNIFLLIGAPAIFSEIVIMFEKPATEAEHYTFVES